MSIRKREWLSPKGQKKSAWLVDYKDQTGKRRSRQFSTKKEADAYADRARDEIRQGRHTHDRDSITVSVAADLWLDAKDVEGLERSTLKRYRELADLYIKPKFGELKLTALSKPILQDWRLELLRDNSRSMAAKVLSALTAVLNHAMEIGAINQNVASSVKVPKAKREKEKIVPPDRSDLKAMIEAASDTERALILTAITTGLRSSELRGLRWQDIDLEVGSITVCQRADAFAVIGAPKSPAARRTVPLPPEVVSELKRWKLRSPPSRQDLAFPSSRGTPQFHNNLLRRMFFPLQKRAGLMVPKIDGQGRPERDAEGQPIMKRKYGFHMLRHAAASGWIAQCIDLKRLQVWMGHETIQLTLDTYGHLLVDQERDNELALKASRDLFA